MKIVFVGLANKSLSIECLSGFLKSRGHDVELAFDPMLFSNEAFNFYRLANIFDISKELIRKINKMKPDLVGFSVFTLNYQRALKIARELKKSNNKIITIFGGIHSTVVPQYVIEEDCVDIVCVGEGEFPLLELLDSMENSKLDTNIKNLWFKVGSKIITNYCRPLISNLDELPFPDKGLYNDIFPGFMNNDYSISTSRGCPFSCSFCSNNVLRNIYRDLGKTVRRRSPSNVISELIFAKKRFHLKNITFLDDNFAVDKNWLKIFANLYKKEIRIPYIGQTHPLFINEDIAKLLVDSGCNFLHMGIQSVSEKTRKEVLHRFEKNKDIENAVTTCKKYKLKLAVDHIFNIPGEGNEEQWQAVEFYNKLKPNIINSYWLQYYPNTEIINTALEHGILRESDIPKINKGLTSTSPIVGFGSKDSFNPELSFRNFQFLFSLIPIMPKFIVKIILKHKKRFFNFEPPLFINIFIKFFINFINRKGSVYFGILKSLIYFISYNLIFKFRYRGK